MINQLSYFNWIFSSNYSLHIFKGYIQPCGVFGGSESPELFPHVKTEK